MTDSSISKNRNFLLLLQGQLVSQAGTQVFAVTLLLWITDVLHSATLVGAVLMASALPNLLLAPLGGVLADRYPKRLILVFTDAARGICLLVFAAEMVFVSQAKIHIPIVFILAGIIGAAGAMFQPAGAAFLPELLPPARLKQANSIVQGSFQSVGLVAQSVSGVLFRIWGAPVLAVVDGASYLYSAVSEYFIRNPNETAKRGEARAARNTWKELVQSFSYVYTNVGMRTLFVMIASLRFFLVPFTVLFPFYVSDHLNATPDWYGYITAAMSVGMVLGSVIAGMLRVSGNAASRSVLGALVLLSAALGSLGVLTRPGEATLSIFVVGVVNGFINVNVVTILQVAVPQQLQGRVMGAFRTITEGLVPVSMLLVGIVADLTGRNVSLIYMICGAAMILLSIFTASSRACRAFLATQPEPRRPAHAVV